MHKVQIFRGNMMYTAYVGSSKKVAYSHIDTARNVLVTCGGTAEIILRVKNAIKYKVTVVNGEWQAENF